MKKYLYTGLFLLGMHAQAQDDVLRMELKSCQEARIADERLFALARGILAGNGFFTLKKKH